MRIRCITIGLADFVKLPDRRKIFPLYEFHILSSLRKRYGVDELLYGSTGNVIFPNFHAVRLLAQKMNSARDSEHFPGRTVRAGDLNAMGLIDEIYHYVLRLYEETENPKVFGRAVTNLNGIIGTDEIAAMLYRFVGLFPPVGVYNGETSADDYLRSGAGDKTHLEITLEETVLLYFANFNPSFKPFRELFDDKDMSEGSVYGRAIGELEKFFRTEKKFGPQNQFIFDLLRAPILASPDSLSGQIRYIKEHWGLILGEKFLTRILSAGDLIREDRKLTFHGAAQTPPVPAYKDEGIGETGIQDAEQFTTDLDWMPNVVLLAKNIYVWLDQLSKKYQRPITKLNEIPDEELDRLSRWNFSALWLIGVWERSPASGQIKKWTGNPEAVASAYSLYDYTIANDLGGEEAFNDLSRRSRQRGIRLAGDMVANHMGIYSKWIVERPDDFIQSDFTPFPDYRFTGGNLSLHPGIELRIEDKYWNQTDAAVVFQFMDKRSGRVRYIYHGNDGTHMPWNDTAQLDFLKPEVRESVIRTIFHVARKFSIIRFDAAMTLTKRHFQRLWYPPPGSGGDIPSRADHALPAEKFNALFPKEFWREVVDRINGEMPGTLLIAEAFWLLEGYFVRSLGMHRVYNSAFMHMLMKEENGKYRELIRNTMHYNPEILKRYVNFMSNPDEESATVQFGKDDKYFGVALLLVTLPGLPMFAHGQIEGYAEKYGMEYKRAYYDEAADDYFIQRHEREIFPLLGKRRLFSQVDHFELYDFTDIRGNLNENVYAFSNRSGEERALICYHNKYMETAGWIKTSVGRNTGSTNDPKIIKKNLAGALDISLDEKNYVIFKDYRTNLEFIRSGKDLNEQGLYVELRAFQYSVFLDFREVRDDTGDYRRLADHLRGQGVIDINDELAALRLQPVHSGLYDLLNQERIEIFRNLFLSRGTLRGKHDDAISSIIGGHRHFVRHSTAILRSSWDGTLAERFFRDKLGKIERLSSKKWRINGEKLLTAEAASGAGPIVLYAWLIIQSVQEFEGPVLFNELKMETALKNALNGLKYDAGTAQETIGLIRLICSGNFFSPDEKNIAAAAAPFFSSSGVREFIKVHEYGGIWYFDKERFEKLLSLLIIAAVIKNSDAEPDGLKECLINYRAIIGASAEAAYDFEKFKRIISV